jgi:AraC-like DNA-binding protein
MNYSVDQLHLLTLNIGFAMHQADWNWKEVRSPFARLYLVTEGEAKVIIDQQAVKLTPGHLYLIPAYTNHSYECNGLFCHYYLHIFENNNNESSVMEDWTFPTEVKASEIDEQLMKRLCEINPFLKLPASNPESYDNHQSLLNNIQLNHRRPFCDKIESRGIIYMLFSRFMKTAQIKSNVKDDRIQETLSYIRHHLNEPIDLTTLADIACMSKDHLIRVFKQETGITPNVYITRHKIEKAELMLITTEYPIKSVAEAVGYDDYSYFNRIFKKITGLTPQQYRATHF